MTHPSPSPLFFINLLFALVLGIAYNTLTNMAGLYITADLGGSSEISVYSMVFFGLGSLFSIPIAHWIADRQGPIKTLSLSLLLYTGFSILCCLAPTFFVFNLFRVAHGFSCGFLYILCRRLVISYAPPSRQELYAFIIVLCYAIAPVLGLSFGAWLAYESFWRWAFYFNAPFSLILAGYFWFFYQHLDTSAEKRFTPFDTVGYLLLIVSTTTLLTAITLCQQLDWYRSPLLVTLTLTGIPTLIFFILWELNHPYPLLELTLLRSPLLSYALLNLAGMFSTYFGMIILITLWLNIYVNYTPFWIALLISVMAIAGVLAFFVSRNLLRRFDPRWTLALAILAFASSCYYSTFFDVSIDFFHLAIARSLAGLGLVLFLFPIFKLAFISYGPQHDRSIFCLIQMTRTLFSSLGAAWYVILWQRRQVFFHERLSEQLTPFSTLTSGYFQQATEIFYLTPEQAKEQLNVFLNQQATSLGLNDVFGYMGYVQLALLGLLFLSFRIDLHKKALS